jgi:uncharacterized protein YdaU (DUF1376 family)
MGGAVTKKLPWYKRDVDAWRGGTRAMSLELRGFYSEFLDAMWDRQGPVENDVNKLAVTLCCNPRTVRKLLPQLIALGKIVETPEGLVNGRMMSELSAAIGREFKSNSAPIQSEFEPKVPKKRVFSTRDLDPDQEEESESDQDQGFKNSNFVGRGGSVSIDAKRTVCANLGIGSSEPLLAKYHAWSGSRTARDPDALFIKTAEGFYRDAGDAVRRACLPLPDVEPQAPLPPVQASSQLAAKIRKENRHARTARTH